MVLSNAVVSRKLATFRVHGAELVVAHFVHRTVEQDGRAFLVDTEFARECTIVIFLDVLTLLRTPTDV